LEQWLPQVAVQIPGMLILAWVFLKVIDVLMDVYGKKIDRLADAVEKLIDLTRSQR
jgi:hypothetical protein